MTSGIEKAYCIILMNHRTMIVGTYNEIDTGERIEKIHSLPFKQASVSRSDSGMGRNYDHIRLFILTDLVNKFLSKRNQRLKIHSAPKFRRKPVPDVSIGKPYHGNLKTTFTKNHIILEIRLAGTFFYGIGSEERSLHILPYPIIDRVSCLYIMISDHYCIISYIINHPCIQVGGNCVYEIIIERCIVSLKTITGIYQDHVVLTPDCPQAIHIGGNGKERRSCGIVYIQ